MAYTSAGVVAKALMRIAEVTPVTYELFAGLAFYPTDVFTIVHMVKGVWHLRGWRPKLAMAWLFYSSILILAMPNMIDASTGYLQPQALYFRIAGDIQGKNYSAPEQVPAALQFALDSGNLSDVELSASRIQDTNGALHLIPVWVFGTYVVWLDAQHNSELTRKGRTMGTWRAIADLAEAMTLELGPHTNGCSNLELVKTLEDRPPIKYDTQVDEKGLNYIILAPRTPAKLKLSFESSYG